jgi:hypothetical protein
MPERFALAVLLAADFPRTVSVPRHVRSHTTLVRRIRTAALPLGTDVTNSPERATYRRRVTQFTEELTFLSEEDKDWIMRRSILARLRWN